MQKYPGISLFPRGTNLEFPTHLWYFIAKVIILLFRRKRQHYNSTTNWVIITARQQEDF